MTRNKRRAIRNIKRYSEKVALELVAESRRRMASFGEDDCAAFEFSYFPGLLHAIRRVADVVVWFRDGEMCGPNDGPTAACFHGKEWEVCVEMDNPQDPSVHRWWRIYCDRKNCK